MHPVQKKRIEAGLTVSELAKLAELSVGTIYRIELDEKGRKVRYDSAKAVANALGCTVENLFKKTELTDNGRPAHSNYKITITTTTTTTVTIEGIFCPRCRLQLPVMGDCDTCAA